MHSRFPTYALMSCAVAVLSGPIAAHAIDELPFISADELHCQRVLKDSSNEYVNKVFTARNQCLVGQLKGTIGRENNCRASVDAGTGDAATDDSLRTAQTKVLADITTACLATNLAILGFPGSCEDSDGPPFTAFDLEVCTRDTADTIIYELIGIEQPPLLPVYQTVERECQANISKKSVEMFTNELIARSNCAYKQLDRKIDLSVDCRAEDSRDAPATGHAPTDTSIVAAHNNVLRELANSCGGIDLELIGFPNECPGLDTGTFTLTSLIECLFETHHQRLLGILDTGIPLTKNCGNSFIDDFETCDDGDDKGGRGDICNAYCIANTTCGGPMGAGHLTINDALFILRVAVGLETCDLALCDVDSNGLINTTDVLRVLRAVVGLPSELHCPAAIIPGTPR